MKQKKQNLSQLVGTAILAALVVVLQTFVVIPIGIFFITLTLVPIIIGAILYGSRAGAFLGAVFGVTVAVQVVTGAAGALSFMMFERLPVVTLVLCVIKGALAGLASGMICSAMKKSGRNKLAVILSSISAPIVNTGVFVLGLFVFYFDLMTEFAVGNAYASTAAFIFIGIVGLNFIVEFAVNVALIPIVLRILHIVTPKSKP